MSKKPKEGKGKKKSSSSLLLLAGGKKSLAEGKEKSNVDERKAFRRTPRGKNLWCIPSGKKK